MSDNYWELVYPTYIENWPRALCSLSIAQTDIPLTVEAARRLGTNIQELGEAFCETDADREQSQKAFDWSQRAMWARHNKQPEPPDRVDPPKVNWVIAPISDIRKRVQDAIAAYPAGCFIRLGSRSPKDSWDLHRTGGKITTGDLDPLRYLLDCSERIMEDLLLAIHEEYPPHIFVRQWIDIPRWSEFRCFMENRKLVGISQYNYLDGEAFQEIINNAGCIQWAIKQFFPSFRDASHLDNVIFDVFVRCRKVSANTSQWEVKLLEINPFFNMTDPCLFSWNKPRNGDFVYNK
jgi:hypothetical protein